MATFSSSPAIKDNIMTDIDILIKTDFLAHANIIVDDHVDSPNRLSSNYEDLSKICHKNQLRVWLGVEEYAKNAG